MLLLVSRVFVHGLASLLLPAGMTHSKINMAAAGVEPSPEWSLELSRRLCRPRVCRGHQLSVIGETTRGWWGPCRSSLWIEPAEPRENPLGCGEEKAGPPHSWENLITVDVSTDWSELLLFQAKWRDLIFLILEKPESQGYSFPYLSPPANPISLTWRRAQSIQEHTVPWRRVTKFDKAQQVAPTEADVMEETED